MKVAHEKETILTIMVGCIVLSKVNQGTLFSIC
jgi:hypothetical protein